MSVLTSLSPALVWKYFSEILEIPRPSKKEEKIIAYLEQFAINQKLIYKKDAVGNIVIKKPASAGCENAPIIVLQSHVDMVCEKNSDVKHDFWKDSIKPKIEGDWVKAEGTTLGADNGIGIAAQLAVLSDKSLKHGPIECLFTVDEETGLTGAKKLAKNLFCGKVLINLDSEDEGEIFIGCAGGIDTSVEYEYVPVEADKKLNAIKVKLFGLKGGHSGDDINKGLANSNQLLSRFLWSCYQKFEIVLGDFQGGNLRNAIPREAEAVILIRPKYTDTFIKDFTQYQNTIKNEYSITEPDLKMEYSEVIIPKTSLSKKETIKLLNCLYACPNGVISMSQAVEGLVETSTNLASVHFKENNRIIIGTSQRSSVESAKRDIAHRIESMFKLIGAEVSHGDGYPGWSPNKDSKILEISKEVYSNLFGNPPKVKAIHAGLECGLFLEKYPGLDMVSFGPTLRGVHSPDERMQISSVDKFWKFLVAILEKTSKQ
jgi:dipeptidase D